MLKYAVSLLNSDFIDRFDCYETVPSRYIDKPVSIQAITYGYKPLDKSIFDSIEECDRCIEFIKPTIEWANKCGANLVFGAPSIRRFTNETSEDNARYFFTKVNDLCKTSFSIENCADYGETEWMTLKDTIFYVKQLNLSHVKVNLDIGSASHDEEVLYLIEDYVDLIGHVHVSPPRVDKDHTIASIRHFIEEVLDTLDGSGYSHYVSLESFNSSDLDIYKEIVQK